MERRRTQFDGEEHLKHFLGAEIVDCDPVAAGFGRVGFSQQVRVGP